MSDTISPTLATKIERSENKITATLTACDISAAGQSWIDNCFDLFKDDQGRAPCIGRPDGQQKNIIVSKLVETITITRPASVPAGSTWDCHVVNLQQNNLVVVSEWEVLAPNLIRDYNPPRPSYNYGGVQVMAGAAGSTLGMPQVVGNIGVPYAFWGGQVNARVIGKAHQIINNTAPLTVQGNLLYYERSMENPEDGIITQTLVDAAAAARYGVLEFYDDSQTFQNTTALIQLPKTRQHLAKEGVYQVAGECDTVNMSGTDRAMNIMVRDNVNPNGVYICPVGWVAAPPTAFIAPNAQTLYYPFRSPFNVCGSYLTGLSSDTVLTVQACWLIETNPPVSDLRMMSLAFPAPARDNCALEVYSKINHKKPAGCPVKNNAVGDWIQTIGDLASLAGLPGAGLISTGGKFVNKIQEFYNSEYGKDWAGNNKGNNPSEKKVDQRVDKLRKQYNNIKYDRLFPGTSAVRKPQKQIQNTPKRKPPNRKKPVKRTQK